MSDLQENRVGKNQKNKDFPQDINSLIDDYEKQIFDLKELLKISRSLNSNLDYNNLIDSLLLICMGQLQVTKIGLFTKKAIDHSYLTFHRNYQGFEPDSDSDATIPENSSLLAFFEQQKLSCYTMPELFDLFEDVSALKIFTVLEPTLIIPLLWQKNVNGIIILGDRIDNQPFREEEKEFIANVASFAAVAIHNAFMFEVATTDMMTKLKLRHFFMTNLTDQRERAGKQGLPLSIIMLDIDHFKKLNDTYGHTFGDEVLRKISAVVRDHVRQIDIAARYGGEEFIILLPEVDAAEAKNVAERVRKAIEKQVYYAGDAEVRATISLGVAQLDKKRDLTSEDFINRADQALYDSKQNGRNRASVAK